MSLFDGGTFFEDVTTLHSYMPPSLRSCSIHGAHSGWMQFWFDGEQSPTHYCLKCIRDLLHNSAVSRVYGE